MNDLRTAAQQALDDLRDLHANHNITYAGTISRLEAALAQQQANQTWVCPDSPEHRYKKPGHCEDCGKVLVLAQGCDRCNHPLYAATRCRVCGRVTEQAEPVEPVAAERERCAEYLMQQAAECRENSPTRVTLESCAAVLRLGLVEWVAQQAEPVQVAERERIASQWDGCVTHQLDTFGPVDIGASIRAGELVGSSQQAEPVCKCDLRTRLVGDGCEVCNPKLAAELAQQAEPVPTHRINSWGFCGVCRHDRIPGEGCARQECPDSPQQAEPVEPITRLFGTLPVHDAQQTEPTVPSDCADSHQPAQAEPDAYGYASRLAVAIWEKHYKDIAPQWKPLDDLVGVLTQIDNMVAGMTRLAQQAEPVEPVGRVVSANCEYATVQWLKQTSDVGGGDPKNSWSWPIAGDAVYTAPPQRKPLTEEEIKRLWYDNGAGIELSRFSSIARAVERALEEEKNRGR